MVKISENPKTTDVIEFDIPTPDENGCFLSDPYRVDKITIFYLQKNFISTKDQEYLRAIVPDAYIQKIEAAEKKVCESPTPENIIALQTAREEAFIATQINSLFFNDSVTVEVVGSPAFPAWLSTDEPNALIEHVTEDENGNPIYGRFKFTWRPVGVREGNYIICWNWTPNIAGDILSAHVSFDLRSDLGETTTIPTHRTRPGKYELLLERYLPEMFKMVLCEGDQTPFVLKKFNDAVAAGFTVIEDLVNQVVDLQDANAVHEAILPYLSNFFNLKLRSEDSALWRRQIKRAIPLFKKKGTLNGLKEALAQAGILVTNFSQLWQVTSPYTWQDAFLVENEEKFELTYNALPTDLANFGLFLLPVEDSEFISLPPEYVTFSVENNKTFITWNGENLSLPILLQPGDILRILYKYNAVPNAYAQSIENYIRTLDLADSRDPRGQKYPPKNWNVRLIEDKDPLFSVIVPVRNPFHDPIVFGHIRTEFPYSENIYNMDEYNGSKRCSFDPCDISRDFIDSCGSCISSKFTLDVEIEDLTSDRIFEAQEIIDEYKPFHSIIHALNFSGSFTDFVQVNDGDMKILATLRLEENLIAGTANSVFHRAIRGGLNVNAVRRDILANADMIMPSSSGTAYNEKIVVFCPSIVFEDLGIGDNVFQILGPHPHAGLYSITNANGNYADIHGSILEPINQSAFTFRLSNLIYLWYSAKITQDDLFKFSDPEVNFAEIGVEEGIWQISVLTGSTATLHNILKVLPDGSIILEDLADELPTTNLSGLTYSLIKDMTIVLNSDTGVLNVTRRGRVDKNETNIEDIRNYAKLCDYFEYSGTQYQISEFINENEFYITGYDLGDVVGVPAKIYRRLVDNAIGYLSYFGIALNTAINLESILSISNGANPPPEVLENNKFKENFLIVINDEFYKIEDINTTFITLGGPEEDWKTLGAGGTPVLYSVIHFTKNSITINGQNFAFIDRRGQEVIETSTESIMPFYVSAIPEALSSKAKEVIGQEISVSYKVEYLDGSEDEEVDIPDRFNWRRDDG